MRTSSLIEPSARQVSSPPPSTQQVRTQQASPAADQSATMAKLFSAYDVCETSHHLQITHLDLHICDDIHAKDKGGISNIMRVSLCRREFCRLILDILLLIYVLFLSAVINKRITGGAMQLSFSSITLDYYPFHRAGMGLCKISSVLKKNSHEFVVFSICLHQTAGRPVLPVPIIPHSQFLR